MGRAESKLKAQRQQEADAQRQIEEQRRARIRAEEELDLKRVESLVPRVQAALKRDDYEWAHLVPFERKTLFGGFKRTEVAGVTVCSFVFTFRGERAEGRVSLLRDGRFVSSGVGGSGILDLSFAREDARYSRHGVRIAGGMSINVRDIADGLEQIVQEHEA